MTCWTKWAKNHSMWTLQREERMRWILFTQTSPACIVRSPVPNQKLWMTANVRVLLKQSDSAFRTGDKTALTTARVKLPHAIREAKRAHAKKIHNNFQDNGDTRRMWQGIQLSIQHIIPHHLIEKLSLLGLNAFLCTWILDFLTRRPQSVRFGNSISSTTTQSTGAPQGCVLSPLLFTLLTHDCVAMHSSNHIVKFANDMSVVGLISKNDESAYGGEVKQLTAWCEAKNIDKTKEMVVDFRRAKSDHSPLIIKSTNSLVFIWWTTSPGHSTPAPSSKKAQQHLYFLRSLRKAHLPPPILTMFYRRTIESILCSCITAWFGNCTISDRKTLQRIVRTAEKIIGVSLPSIMHIYITRCIRKANSIVDDPTHPSHTLFTYLPSGKRFRSIRAIRSRLCNSFFPQAIRLLNTQN
ncbi:hypothetical protein HF521_000321 [Silurus meridionalis]|uniref:Reverse transcriptase domain-containing protein n=1 Tax=Silurus meridionalis TaxID=175797 RepID=A0A8T0BZU5_SILME|nr:hypothetical protein HF521_000321 [Silurus meridionalis]